MPEQNENATMIVRPI